MKNKIKITIFFLIILAVPFSIKAQEGTLTNEKIVEMTKNGLEKEVIIKIISKASKTNFDVSPDGAISLRKSGVDNTVISAMLDAKSVKSEPTTDQKTETETTETTTAPTTTTTPTTGGTTSDGLTQAAKTTCLQNQLGAVSVSNRKTFVCDLVRAIVAKPTPNIDFDNDSTLLLDVLAGNILADKNITPLLINAQKKQAAVTLFTEAEKDRTDKQIGGDSNSSGTTSVAVKGGAPSIIGWAIEQGAATSSFSGTTATIRVNPVGLLRAINGEGFFGNPLLNNLTSKNPNQKTASSEITNNFLRKFSLGFSFDTTRGQETPTFIVSKQQLSAVSARYEFVNQRVPQSSTAQKKFRAFVDENEKLYRDYGDLVNTFTFKETNADGTVKFRNKEFEKHLKACNENIKKVKQPVNTRDNQRYNEEVGGVIEGCFTSSNIEEILSDPVTKQAFEKFVELSVDYQKERDKFAEEINKGTLVTLEYTNFREPVAPDTSNFRFIYENGNILKKTDFTFNASLTMYNKRTTIADVKRIRDFQFALQTETKFKKWGEIGAPTLTFAGKYERLNGDVVDKVTGIVTAGTKGDIALGQIKFTIPIVDWGIKLPLSLTFANRSELIKESHVRANFGFTFDLDPLFARFKPF